MSRRASFEPDFAVVVKAEADGAAARIQVLGELDSGSCQELTATFRDVVRGGVRQLRLDLSETTFIDSAGTRALIMIERAAEERGLELVVTPPPEQVTELLRMAGLVGRMRFDGQAAPVAEDEFMERTELELPRDPHSPARARAEVRERLSAGDGSQLANVVLLTSELVTNAVIHPRGVSQTPIGLRVIAYQDRVRIEVEDAGDGFDRVPSPPPEGDSGRGLFLVDQFADRWGREHVQTAAGSRFRVWFETAWRPGEIAAGA